MSIDACLALYGLLTALALPFVLERQPMERRPRLGVAAWLIATVSVIASWLGGGWILAHHPDPLSRALGVGLVGVVGTRLCWALTRTWMVTRQRRAMHVDAAALLGRHDRTLGAVVLDSPEPAAYCLPRPGGGLVVVTTGAASMLSPAQLLAVLEHERAHLAGRHHALLGLGQALSQVVPGLPLFRRLGDQIHRLLEMQADDAAARVYGPRTVASAIATMGAAITPLGAMGVSGSTATARVLRLLGDDRGRGARHFATLLAATVLALAPYLALLPNCPHPW
jgi:hypothetical protein